MKKALRSLIFVILAFCLISMFLTTTRVVYAEGTQKEQETKQPKKINKKVIGIVAGVSISIATLSLVGMTFVYKKKQQAYEEARYKLKKQLQEQRAQEAEKKDKKDSLNTTL